MISFVVSEFALILLWELKRIVLNVKVIIVEVAMVLFKRSLSIFLACYVCLIPAILASLTNLRLFVTLLPQPSNSSTYLHLHPLSSTISYSSFRPSHPPLPDHSTPLLLSLGWRLACTDINNAEYVNALIITTIIICSGGR